MIEHVHSSSPEKTDQNSVGVHKWRNLFGCRISHQRQMKIQVGIPRSAPAKKCDVFLVFLETRLKKSGDAGRNASYTKCCDLVQCVKGND